MAGNDSCYRLVAIADHHFLSIPHKLDMSAEMRLKIADIYGLHCAIIANMTMLVMLFLNHGRISMGVPSGTSSQISSISSFVTAMLFI